MRAERAGKQSGSGICDGEGWGDFVTGKEKARRRGPSGDLVWRWVRLWRSEGHRGISPW